MSTTIAKSLDLDRLPPHDHNAEKAAIAACLRDPDVFPSVRELVSAESFFFDAHQQVFRATCVYTATLTACQS